MTTVKATHKSREVWAIRTVTMRLTFEEACVVECALDCHQEHDSDATEILEELRDAMYPDGLEVVPGD